MIELALTLSAVAAVLSIAALIGTIIGARLIDRRWPRPSRNTPHAQRGAIGPDHTGACSHPPGESPYTSVSAGPPPGPASTEWPEQAPEIGLLHLYGATHRLDYLGRHEITVTERHGRLAGMAAAAPVYGDAWTTLRSAVLPLLRSVDDVTEPRLQQVTPRTAGETAIAEYARVREAWLGDRNSTGDPVSTCIACGHTIVLRPSSFGWSHAGPNRPHTATPPYRLGVPEQPGPALAEGADGG